jgi:hypothetical protein
LARSEAFYDRNGILLDFGELMARVPGTTEEEFASWAEEKGESMGAARMRRGGTLIELLISLSIMLNRAMHILD